MRTDKIFLLTHSLWGKIKLFEIDIEAKKVNGFCDVHGFFENVGVFVGERIVWSGCNECAAQLIERENRAFAIEAERLYNRRLFNAARIPKRFENKGLENYRVENKGQENALNIALQYVDDLDLNLSNGSGLLFYGASGTGKTHLAIGIGKKFLEVNLSVMYVRASSIIREVKESWSKESKRKESDLFAKLGELDLLIVDELGRQFGTATERMILFELINGRYEQMKPTIGITNLDGANLAECLGFATLDRLREKGKSVCFDWKSFRS